MVAHTEMLAAYVANGEGQEGSSLKILENVVGDNPIAAEAGEEHRVPDSAARRVGPNATVGWAPRDLLV
jgi:hypothetical protein